MIRYFLIIGLCAVTVFATESSGSLKSQNSTDIKALSTAHSGESIDHPVNRTSVAPLVIDTAMLDADEFRHEYWHKRVDSLQINRLIAGNPAARSFLVGMKLYNNHRYKEAVDYFEESIVYSKAYRIVSVFYLFNSYFELRNYEYAFTVLYNYYPELANKGWKDRFTEKMIETSTFLASHISRNSFWSADSIAEYKDYLNKRDSLLVMIDNLDRSRAYNKSRINKELAHSAYLRGNKARGDSLTLLILEQSSDKDLIAWAYTEYKEFTHEKVTDFTILKLLGNAEYEMEKYKEAIATFKSLLGRNPSAKTREDMLRKIAFSYKKEGKYSQAIAYYKQLIEKGRSTSQPNDYLNIARCYRALKHIGSANKWYDLFVRKYPNHSKALEIKWTDAFELEQENKLTKALKSYNKFTTHQKKSTRGMWVEFRKGYVHYKKKHYKTAIKIFKKVIRNPDLIWPGSAARLYLGKSYLALGDSSQAKKWFLYTIKDYPVGFYAWRARFHLSDNKLMPESKIPGITLKDMNSEETLDWLRKYQKKTTQMYQDELLEVEILLSAGCWEEAVYRYEEIYARNSGRLDFMYIYAQLFLEYGHISYAYDIARNMIWRVDRKKYSTAPKKLMQLFYMRPYYEQVQQKAEKENVDPYFVLALMRQESIFDSRIKSGAGAYGLMQIMPYTGKALAKREQIDGFKDELLFNPYMAIRLGVRYIGDLMKKYNDEYHVLANYNAGPGPTKRWKNDNGHLELDRYVEEISYWETRDYIKKVMANYWTYKYIWGQH